VFGVRKESGRKTVDNAIFEVAATGSFDPGAVSDLDDAAMFYRRALEDTVQKNAARHLAALQLIAVESRSETAYALAEQLADIDNFSHVLLNAREIDALFGRLQVLFLQKAASKDVNDHLLQLYAMLAPAAGGYSLGSRPLSSITVARGSIVQLPTLAIGVAVWHDTPLSSIISAIVECLVNALPLPSDETRWSVVPAEFTNRGVRVSSADRQPCDDRRDNFPQLVQETVTDGVHGCVVVRDAVDQILRFSVALSETLSDVNPLVTACKSEGAVRHSGTVSAMPGWCWTDFRVGPKSSDEEGLYLSTVIVHEFFHTKLNLVERYVPLYASPPGLLPELFSPWKQRLRPIRQVVHALVTFSAAAMTWSRILDLSFVTKSVRSFAAAEIRRTTAACDATIRDLRDSDALTPFGLALVSECYSRLCRSAAKV